MTVVTRFAPSPTGFLHIGGARTALFNWLFARHHGGKYYLRVEDTDRKRSTEPAVQAILDGLKWLNLPWDGDIVYQSRNAPQHQAVAHQLIERGAAYRCYCTTDEIEEMRARARTLNQPPKYDGRCRHLDPNLTHPDTKSFVVRLKAPLDGTQTVDDLVQGPVSVSNAQLDDMILLRADGSPTYMLSVVVDDHLMGITHIIRGDDHLTNTFRQKLIFDAMAWPVPRFAHIPLIHGSDGAKLSKRHGALGIDAYQDLGILPEALCNYLVRLGWSHGDDEFFDRTQAIQWFGLDHVGRSPARFDMQKLMHMNGHYLRQAPHDYVCTLLEHLHGQSFNSTILNRLLQGMTSLSQRAKSLTELYDNARIYIADRPILMNSKAQSIIEAYDRGARTELYQALFDHQNWSGQALEEMMRAFRNSSQVSLSQITQLLRAALTGTTVSPSIFEVMTVLGREESLDRLKDVL